jgi:hypothetical protein
MESACLMLPRVSREPCDCPLLVVAYALSVAVAALAHVIASIVCNTCSYTAVITMSNIAVVAAVIVVVLLLLIHVPTRVLCCYIVGIHCHRVHHFSHLVFISR